MSLSTTQLNTTVKETLDAVIQKSYDFNQATMKKFKKIVPTEGLTSLGRSFTVQVKSNQSYGSQASEGSAFPNAGRLEDVRATVNYRSQFSSFRFTGDVEDLFKNDKVMTKFNRIVEDTTNSFDEKQAFFLFGDGSGSLGVVTAVAAPVVTCATATATPLGARAVFADQVLNAYNVGGSAYRVGDATVQSVNRSTDAVTFDTAPTATAANDVLVFKGSYNFAPQGFLYHINDSGSWLGLSRSTYTSLQSTVHDAASSALDWDKVEIALLKSRNARGDNAPKFDYMLVGHPVQHKNLRAIARSFGNVQYNANLAGNGKIDLITKDVGIAGMELHEDSWCPPSEMFGLRLDDWAIEEVVPRQLYKHGDGNVLIQSIASSTGYADAKEGRVYWRYNYVCKKPMAQFRIKNLTFTASEVATKRQ